MRVLAPLLLLALLACGSNDAPSAPTPAAPERPPPPPQEPPAPSPWPTDPASLGESLERFEDVTQCETSLRAELPTEIAEVLADLSYDSVVTDVCAGLEAAKARDPSRCEALSVRAAREGCLRRVAVWTGEPDACPPARGVQGRDPLCLAWAARDPDLCDGVSPTDRAACLAVLRDDPARCPDERCRGWVERYGPVVTTDERPRRRRTGATITVEREGEPQTYERGGLERGLVLRAHRCGYRLELELGGAYDEGPSVRLRATLRADLSTEELDARLRWTRAARPEPLQAATLRIRGRPARGGRIRGTLRGEHRLGSELRTITVAFDTWLRDVEALAPRCDQDGTSQPAP